MQNLKQLLNLKSLNFYGHTLAAGVSCSLHNLADRLSNSAVTTDNHTGIILSYRKGELDIVAVDRFGNHDCIGIINDSACNIGKYLNKIHFDTYGNYLMISLFLRRALTVSVG